MFSIYHIILCSIYGSNLIAHYVLYYRRYLRLVDLVDRYADFLSGIFANVFLNIFISHKTHQFPYMTLLSSDKS
jgi:hypothetical protein